MRVIVQTLGGAASLELEVGPESTLGNLKTLCCEHWRFPALLQKLLIGEVEPQDSDQLDSLCLASETELVVTLLLSLSVLEDTDDSLRYDAHQALDAVTGQQGASAESTERAVQAVIACLKDPVGANRRLAVRILGDIAEPEDTRVLSLACAALKDTEEPQVVCAALELIANRAPSGDPAVAEVIDCLANAPMKHGEDVEFAAVRALGSLAQKGDRRCVEALCTPLQDGNGYLRLAVLDLMSVVAEPRDEVALPAIEERLQDRDGNIRVKALEIFAKLAPKDDEAAVAAIIARLADNSAKCRIRALIALSKLVSLGTSKSAVSAVCAAVADEDADVRCVAVEVLPKIAAKGDVEALAAAQARLQPEEDTDPDVVEAATNAVSSLSDATA